MADAEEPLCQRHAGRFYSNKCLQCCRTAEWFFLILCFYLNILNCYSLFGTLKPIICIFCRSYCRCYSSWSGLNCCNCYYSLQNKVRIFLKNQFIYETKIRNYLYALLRGEVWTYTTSLTLWYVQTLLNPATFYCDDCTKLGKWVVMYLYRFCLCDIFSFDYGIVPTAWYFLLFISDTRCATLVTIPVISPEWGKDREVLTTQEKPFKNVLFQVWKCDSHNFHLDRLRTLMSTNFPFQLSHHIFIHFTTYICTDVVF
jgi:hypothetical protein